MENNSLAPLKNISLYVGLAVIAIIVLAALGTYQLLQKRINTPSISQTPSPSPESFGTLATPSPSPVLGTTAPQTQPATGPSFAYWAFTFGAFTAGLYLARFQRKI